MDYLLSRESSYYYEQSSSKRGRSYCFKGSIKQCILLYGEKTKIHFCLTFDVALLSIQEEAIDLFDGFLNFRLYTTMSCFVIQVSNGVDSSYLD